MRILFFLTVVFFVPATLHAHTEVQTTKDRTTETSITDSRILRLIVISVGDKGADFVAFARVASPAYDLIKNQPRQLYCLQLNKKKTDWRLFSPCGKITPVFGHTYRVEKFPDLGKIEEVLSGRPHRYRSAITLAVSKISATEIPKGDPSSIKKFVQSRVDIDNDSFIGIEMLRHGSL